MFSLKYGFALLVLCLAAVYFGSIYYQKLTSKNIMQNDPKILTLEERIKKGELQKMVFAGGCFWCTEAAFNSEFGVEAAVSGYFGGKFPNPTYEDVSSHSIDHREVVQVYFNPASSSIKKLLVNYWHDINPTQADGQFQDFGHQYTTAIYYFSNEQKKLAEESKKVLEESKKFQKKIVVEVLDGQGLEFYPAEEYHQDYSVKNPARYELFKKGSGRSDFIKNNWKGDKTFESFLNLTNAEVETLSGSAIWKKFTPEMKSKRLSELTSLQIKVTQNEDTEMPFENEYDKNQEKGIYVDVVSGEPLYSSKDKFDSGTGWPSFVKPISLDFLTLKTDNYLFYSRTEVKSKIADSHLGHVFDDGPLERGGKRYCMNSAAMRFVPLSEMAKLGYADFVKFVN